MVPGPSAGGLVAGPTTGAISTNPAAYIPDNGLAVAQVNELRGELAQKNPLLTAAATLPQALVTDLTSYLAARETNQQLAAGLAQKHLLITATATLPQALVTDLTSALAARQPLLNNSSHLLVDTVSSRLYLGDVFRFWKADQSSSLVTFADNALELSLP